MPYYPSAKPSLSPELLREFTLHPWHAALPDLAVVAVWIGALVVLHFLLKRCVVPGKEANYAGEMFPWSYVLLDRTGRGLWWLRMFASVAVLAYLLTSVRYFEEAQECRAVLASNPFLPRAVAPPSAGRNDRTALIEIIRTLRKKDNGEQERAVRAALGKELSQADIKKLSPPAHDLIPKDVADRFLNDLLWEQSARACGITADDRSS